MIFKDRTSQIIKIPMALLTLIFSRVLWSHAITPNIYGDAIGTTYCSFPSYASEVIKTIITSREKNTLDYVMIDHIPSLQPPIHSRVYYVSANSQGRANRITERLYVVQCFILFSNVTNHLLLGNMSGSSTII